ncbi:hypothetical protein DPMN_188276 [Dreissena polymorpha]|uniref:Uncharacterized protein n=1 Tax=Dreissena polymorpha TaxID=45954 RepID=A0A9D4DQL2_DREPO|nr:hypothetical protein DPMN_188276 [Dreissena polymorpha]
MTPSHGYGCFVDPDQTVSNTLSLNPMSYTLKLSLNHSLPKCLIAICYLSDQIVKFLVGDVRVPSPDAYTICPENI